MVLKEQNVPSSCPKTAKPLKSHRKYRWVRWILPITGLAAFIWFLIRVIPKPSRATYPCQRLAMPLASGFVVWITGIITSTFAFRKGRKLLRQSRTVKAMICLTVATIAAAAAIVNTPIADLFAADPPDHMLTWDPPEPNNAPVGIAKGLFPGRIAWVHDSNAVDHSITYDRVKITNSNPAKARWETQNYSGYYFEDAYNDQNVIDDMFSRCIQLYTGETDDANAWDALFRHFNKTKGRGDVGYQEGENIAVKINLNTCGWGNVTDYNKTGHIDDTDQSPHLVFTLLKQLVNVVGADQEDIAIGDSIRNYVNHYWDKTQPVFPDVVYFDPDGDRGRTQVVGTGNSDVHWSYDQGGTSDNLPTVYVNADYMINMAILAGHEMNGSTASGKNHYGSLLRTPNEGGYQNLHDSCANSGQKQILGYGLYRALVDITGNEYLGGNTMLYIIDGLWGKPESCSGPVKWNIEPFNGQFPASLFMSQDPVATDSVVADFTRAEGKHADSDFTRHLPTIRDANNDLVYPAYTDDWLHEAAEANDPPSEISYDPNGNGNGLESLGVHEHWNDPNDKKYSRNLDPIHGTGIELITEDYISPGDTDGDGDVDCNDLDNLTDEWLLEDPNVLSADVFPYPDGDGVVDMRDFAFQAWFWLGW